LNSLSNAVKEAKKNGITDIYLLNGTHDEKGERYVTIDYSVSIIGESREHCVVMGGLKMNGNEEDDVNVSNLTLRGSKGTGVYGCYGASIHLDNVSVENSGSKGVAVFRTKRSTMKNCNVSHSKFSGLHVWDGGLMTIDGNATTIHHNCTEGRGYNYGLDTGNPSSSIHLASSLTIETISKNNGGGGNCGGDGTIAIVDNEGTIVDAHAAVPVVQEFCVGPIWSNTAAKEKADKWIANNKPNEGWKFTGEWHSSGGTSYCKFKKVEEEPEASSEQ